MDAPTRQPPGWYPDPWAPGALRWWDGAQWGVSNAPVYRAPETEGLALASIVTAVLGIPIVPIVLGVMGRNRIRESGGTKDGEGLAVAGIIIGIASLALIGVVVAGFLIAGLVAL